MKRGTVFHYKDPTEINCYQVSPKRYSGVKLYLDNVIKVRVLKWRASYKRWILRVTTTTGSLKASIERIQDLCVVTKPIELMPKHGVNCECDSFSDLHKDLYNVRPKGEWTCEEVTAWFESHYEETKPGYFTPKGRIMNKDTGEWDYA